MIQAFDIFFDIVFINAEKCKKSLFDENNGNDILNTKFGYWQRFNFAFNQLKFLLAFALSWLHCEAQTSCAFRQLIIVCSIRQLQVHNVKNSMIF